MNIKENSKWLILNVQNLTETQMGCPFHFKEEEVLLINGYNAPNKFQIFNLKANNLSISEKPFTNNFYHHSKIRLLSGKIHIVSIRDSKRVWINLNDLTFTEGGIDF